MTRRNRVRRVLILCCHCLRNLAFYRAGLRNGAAWNESQFWITVNSNFLDHCILEWCKLFADSRGKHHWRKVVTEPNTFWAGLLMTLGLTDIQFETYIVEMRTYRDKFVAHLDLEEIMHIPKLRCAQLSIEYLHDYVLKHEDDGDFFPEVPVGAAQFYKQYAIEGKGAYAD
jgi:hypothetical protein